ncbi:GNAT family N-acetyltransferase (plasmid) [Bradyrhizobium sp. CCGUVB1N3]|uniref:acyl-homoserine-lactone synthase n=1 Tax=Bradyrhizobium sp. CCGUVB1N3 TaxID=2949629 RepID=UPI0020B33101|nr:GNAT family N-acyltransferase [Bradyrhizobium sp. CCGUVB1N3]MCP3477897.1 GNAT family N-acetyltransferase [Bradyrhizobium sp. CCGUVB1N3]
MLIVVDKENFDQHRDLPDRAFRSRHDVFVEEKGREDFRRADMRERDQFDDDEDAVHLILLRDDQIIGYYQRLLPTTRPHLLSSDLCHTIPPRGSRVAEWTRFCVALGFRETRPIVALRMSFNHETLAAIHEVRGSADPVLNLPSALSSAT